MIPSSPLQPFADESSSLQISGLTVENRTDRVSLFGSLELTRDKAGLQQALALKTVLDQVVAAMQGDALPDKIQLEPQQRRKSPLQP